MRRGEALVLDDVSPVQLESPYRQWTMWRQPPRHQPTGVLRRFQVRQCRALRGCSCRDRASLAILENRIRNGPTAYDAYRSRTSNGFARVPLGPPFGNEP